MFGISIPSSYTKPNSRSNMAVAELDALSGFRFAGDQLDNLMDISDLQRAELDKEDTRMNLYFNPVFLTKFKIYEEVVITMKFLVQKSIISFLSTTHNKCS